MLTMKGRSENVYLPVMGANKLITMDEKSASDVIGKLSSHSS